MAVNGAFVSGDLGGQGFGSITSSLNPATVAAGACSDFVSPLVLSTRNALRFDGLGVTVFLDGDVAAGSECSTVASAILGVGCTT